MSPRHPLSRFCLSLAAVAVAALSLSCGNREPSPEAGKKDRNAEPSGQAARAAAQRLAQNGQAPDRPTGALAAPDRESAAGEIFGVPVSLGNYHFAKLVAAIFARPWGGADLPENEREAFVWEQLILHYTAFERGIQATDQELEDTINQLLRDEKQAFTRAGDPEAYKDWAKRTLNENVELLENQMRYLIQIKKLKDQVREEQVVSVTEEEMKREFFDQKNHVGGEAVMFDSKAEADAFYAGTQDAPSWEKMKASGGPNVRPVSMMTLQAYMDLWGVPREQMYAFHGSAVGTVGAPMPFGTQQWAVYRLLDKRTGDLEDFPKEKQALEQRLVEKKKYEGMKRWIEQRKADARLKISVKPVPAPVAPVGADEAPQP